MFRSAGEYRKILSVGRVSKPAPQPLLPDPLTEAKTMKLQLSAALIFTTLMAGVTGCGPVNNMYKQDTGTVEQVPGPPPATATNMSQPGAMSAPGIEPSGAPGEVTFVDDETVENPDAMLSADTDAIEPLPEVEPQPMRTYTIKKGDSYWKIAQAVYGDPLRMQDIVDANPQVDPKKLQIGDEIVLPE